LGFFGQPCCVFATLCFLPLFAHHVIIVAKSALLVNRIFVAKIPQKSGKTG
jgi:hypothetical protein